jgi:L-asparaginase
MPEYFKNLRLGRRLKFSPICMKDSRDLVAGDRKRLLQRLQGSPYRKLLVTHGTYTMAETATYLEKNFTVTDQVVVLTGSLVPLQGFAPSDASFNLGYSLAQLDALRPGIYICFNGVTYRSARFEEFNGLVHSQLKSQFTH